MNKFTDDNYDSNQIDIKDIFKIIKRNKKYFFSILSVLFIIFTFSGKNYNKVYKSELELFFKVENKNFSERAERLSLLSTIEELLISEFIDSENTKNINFENKKIKLKTLENKQKPSKLKFRFFTNTNILQISNSNNSLEKSINKLLKIQDKIINSQEINGLEIKDIIDSHSKDEGFNKDEIQKITNPKESNYEINYFSKIGSPTVTVSNEIKNEYLLLTSFFSSLLITIILIFIKERISPFIIDFKKLRNTIDENYIDTITLDNSVFSKKNIQYIFKKNNIPSSVGIINGANIGLKSGKEKLIKYFRNLNIDIELVNIFDEKSIIKHEKLLIFLPENLCKYSDLKILKSYLRFYRDKIIGWIYLKEN